MRIVVIGGGAAGFFAAIECARSNPAASVTILESGSRFLRKVKISGGGRCNVTHACFDPERLAAAYPRGANELRGPFSRFQPRDTAQWFESRGVRLKTEADGRMFPVTDDSQTIIDCLLAAARNAGVELKTNTAVSGLQQAQAGFRILTKSSGQPAAQLNSGEKKFAEPNPAGVILADRVLLSGGSHPSGYRFAKALGHAIEPLAPSLFTFAIADPQLHELSGISIDPAYLTLNIADRSNAPIPQAARLPETALQEQDAPAAKFEQTGPVLITHWGLSGPAVLKLSAWAARELLAANYRAELTIDWLPNIAAQHMLLELKKYKEQNSSRLLRAHVPEALRLPLRFWQYLCAKAGVDTNSKLASLSNKALQQLAAELSRCKLPVSGKGVFKEEFVTCGGVRLSEVDFATMQSRVCPGLYFAGEILDIDGITGGYNFQSAWTTGWIAGQSMSLGQP